MKCDLCGEPAEGKLEGGYVAQGDVSLDGNYFSVRPRKGGLRRPMVGCARHVTAWRKQHIKFVSQGNEFVKYVRDMEVRIRWRRSGRAIKWSR